jgi:hypothetical protein
MDNVFAKLDGGSKRTAAFADNLGWPWLLVRSRMLPQAVCTPRGASVQEGG